MSTKILELLKTKFKIDLILNSFFFMLPTHIYIVKTIENHIADEELKWSDINTYYFIDMDEAIKHAHKVSNDWFHENVDDVEKYYDKNSDDDSDSDYEDTIAYNENGQYNYDLDFSKDGTRWECSVKMKKIQNGKMIFSDNTKLLIHGC